MSPAIQPTLVSASGVTVERNGRKLIDAVDVEVKVGEVVALTGPNGAGKSTLIAVLSGELSPNAGSVEHLGQPITSWGRSALARQRAVLAQATSVDLEFTSREVVEFARTPWMGQPTERDEDRVVDWALNCVDAAELAERTMPTLSGGESARVHLARVLCQDTNVLFLDEPTAALDIGHAEAVLSAARGLARSEGTAVVIVIHDLNAAARWCDRIVLLDAGRVVADGSPGDVLTGERLTSVYAHPVTVMAHPSTGQPLVVPEPIDSTFEPPPVTSRPLAHPKGAHDNGVFAP